ncbi:unnamed protein product [Discula destructiva]
MSNFEEHKYYPNGLADTVGYWTEDRILGGVALFDRGESGLESKDMYFQSARRYSTFRTWRVLPTQFDAMTEFFLAEAPNPTSPFPIMSTDENRHRYDPWYARPNHVYRDAWELQRPPKEIPDPRYERDVRSTHDYPELEDTFKKISAHAEGLPYCEPDGTVVPPGEVCEQEWLDQMERDYPALCDYCTLALTSDTCN